MKLCVCVCVCVCVCGLQKHVGAPPPPHRQLHKMWPWGILGVCHQGSMSISRCLSWTEPWCHMKDTLLLLASMLVHTRYFMYPLVKSPRFLSCSFMVLQHPGLNPSHSTADSFESRTWHFILRNRSDGKWEKLFEFGRTPAPWQTQKRTTRTGLTEHTFKTVRSCLPGWGGKIAFSPGMFT